MTETHDYQNEATKAEKREVLRNESYLSRQQNTADDAGGRYASSHRARSLDQRNRTNATSARNSPWHHDPVPATEPLGFSVDAMEPVGTPTEIQSSLAPNLQQWWLLLLTLVIALEGPAVDVATFPASSAAGSSMKRRRDW